LIPLQGRRRLVAAALLLSACASAETEVDPLHAEKVVLQENLKGASQVPDAEARETQAAAELASAEASLRAGDALATIATVNHALLEGVPASLEPRFRELRARARGELVATKICRVRVVPEKDAVAAGREIPVRVEFVNLSAATLQVPHALRDSSDATVVVKLVREDFDVFGNTRTTDFTLPVPIESDIVVGPGSSYPVRLTIPAEMTSISHQGFSVMTLSGTFRPVALRVGESEFFDAIPLEPARVRIFLQGYEQLTADPLGSLKKAVAKRSPPHLLTAAELLSPQDRAEARTFLEAAKAKDPPLAVAIDAALSRVRGPDVR
jgi:hypothetical protein